MRKLIAISFLLTILFAPNIKAQSGMLFSELAKRMEPYFGKEMINDVERQLPQGSDYRIWGWDVGDFSGDDYPDFAVTIKIADEKKKVSRVYLFVDVDGYLTKVSSFAEEFVELPLEIGVVIRYKICYITRKIERFNWVMTGYKFDNGALILYETFETEKIGRYTHEQRTNYYTLRNSEKYIVTSNDNIKFHADYLTIPSFNRRRMVYKGYQDEAFCNYVDYVSKGAYYWEGDKDCSFSVGSAYNEKYIYMTVEINDDKIVEQRCDTCPGDHITVWFDASPKAKEGNRLVEYKNGSLIFRKRPKRGIFSFKIYPGNFKTEKAYLKDVGTTDNLYDFQTKEVYNIKAVSTLKDGGYVIKFKIPFLVFACLGPPIKGGEIAEFGCTVVVHDIDNGYRPEEETRMATSKFNPSDPSTYGNMLIIPKDKWYGKTVNIYRDKIVNFIRGYGF